MAYISTPTSGPHAPGRSSQRAVDLSTRISQVIVDFQRSFPDTRPADVQQAMRLAWGSSFDTNRRHRAVLVALLVSGLLFFALGLFVLGA